MNTYVLTLYIAGQTPRSERAITNLRQICEHFFAVDEYELRIVDVLEQPDVAERLKILATPMLVKELPPPTRRIIGDLSNAQQVMTWIEPGLLHDETAGMK